MSAAVASVWTRRRLASSTMRASRYCLAVEPVEPVEPVAARVARVRVRGL
ncbi:MAG: hypothetical protein QOF84_147 [Streptomyces sp.]|nr:hypothetical protein [Streptomyces sp.]